MNIHKKLSIHFKCSIILLNLNVLIEHAYYMKFNRSEWLTNKNRYSTKDVKTKKQRMGNILLMMAFD